MNAGSLIGKNSLVTGAGHWPADESPDEFARILRDFFEEGLDSQERPI